MSDDWLLLKRDLFYRPNNCGYTGIRDEAGRYSYDRAMEHESAGGKVMLVSEAPEFLPAAYDDIVITRLTKQRDELVKALEFIRDGYDNQDVNHVDFRVKAYQAALAALGDVGSADR